jgi:hypothetical protein
MAAACDLPHWHIVSSNGRRDLPRGLMAYTTRGGVSAYTVRSMIPVLCRSRSCWESVRCVIPVIARFSSENQLCALEKLLENGGFPSSTDNSCRSFYGAKFVEFNHVGPGSTLYTMYHMCATYSHVTMLAPSSSILTTTTSGLDF